MRHNYYKGKSAQKKRADKPFKNSYVANDSKSDCS